MTNGELIKKLRKERRISQAQLAAGISTPILSLLVGEHRLNRVIGLTMAVFIFGNILSAIAPTFFVLILSRIITALVAGITISIAITFATFITPKAKQAWIVSWVFSGFSIASVFGVPTGTWLSSKVGWRLTFWIIAILSTLVLVAFQLALPHDLKQKKVEHFTDQFKILTDKRILLGIFVPVLSLGSVYIIYTYITPILTDSFGYSINFVTIYLVIYGIASLMSNQTTGRLASKNGFQRIFKFYIVQILALLGVSVFFKMPIIDLVLIILLGFTIYLAGATCQLFYMHIAEEKYPQSLVLASTFNPIFSNWWCHLYCHFIGNSLGLNSSHSIIINLKGVIYEKF
ncbi:MFS transporter [Fructilactobacillus sanfranciscensis]|uniref:MFS transporter n=1 Tax=Fructilactobacillus sanfranciscensis TaxID=1625 RepID=A0A5C4THR9_FRUSA|nr:MFS transporter [Fructilactobacillus sanfranciscensis]MVF15504.1 MFS transporter [Fructilactobacillus sanfranciscensis]TNK90000.1 MFS transporter [Fructilactobacillus sanfranciscensis]TNL00444.1 MFS transporter [Fructilactobacillus sanfranciscensis]